MNIDQLKKTIAEFVEAQQDAISAKVGKDSIKKLQEVLSGPEAISFTMKMNQLYKDQGVTGDDGEPLTIKHPENLPAKAVWGTDGLSGYISLTPEEDRWLKANQVFGNNILGGLGFKYTSA